MGFLMDGLDAEAYDRTYRDRDLVRRVLRYFWPQTRRVGVVSLAILLTALADTAMPIYISRSLDDLQAGRANIVLVAAIIVVLGCLTWVLNYVRRALTSRAVGDMVLQLR